MAPHVLSMSRYHPKNNSNNHLIHVVLPDPNVFNPLPPTVVPPGLAPEYYWSTILQLLNRINTDGPVLNQTDVYLLGANLLVNPILLQLSNISHHIRELNRSIDNFDYLS